jgi:hypothetical protein
MPNLTLERIEERIRSTERMDEKQKREMLVLLDELKREIAPIAETHAEQAGSIAGFAEVSSSEATRADKNPELLDLSLRGFRKTVEEFEASHPKIVGVVNRICMMLSDSGI